MSLKKELAVYLGFELKTLVFLGLQIYWVIIITALFTVELKYTKTNKVTLSPHQIAFHETSNQYIYHSS